MYIARIVVTDVQLLSLVLTLCEHMDCSMLGFFVLHYLPDCGYTIHGT